jgi:putative ABC transport system ATP-binding protein
MPDTVLRLVDVSKEYDSEGERPFLALDRVSLEITKGELISVIGPSGSGKSTMLHMLGCLDKPTGGEIYLDGKAISKMTHDQLADARRDNIGFVFQAFSLASTLNVFENVELPLLIREVPEEERKRIVLRNLEAVGLLDKVRSMPSQLSGGEKQRVAIARALANNPKILLADEPTGNLDSKSSADIIAHIIGLGKSIGITVILVTHDPRVAERTNRIVRIMDGKIIEDTGMKHKRRGAK